MLEMKTILYATDFSEAARPAFAVACTLAKEANGRLVILHVERPPLSSLGGMPIVPPLPNEYDCQALWDALRSYQPARMNIVVEHRLEYGDPVDVILETAEQIGCDLIVLGTHGRTGLRRLLMGSVAERVLRHAPCSVLTVRAAGQALPQFACHLDQPSQEKVENYSGTEARSV